MNEDQKRRAAADTGSKIIRNTLFTNFGYVWGLVISLLLTPFIVSSIGVERYGLFVLIEVVFGMFALLDVAGIGTAFVKFISEFHARGEQEKINRIVVIGTVYYAVFWGVVGAGAWFFRYRILGFFSIPPNAVSLAGFAFTGIMAVTFLQGSLSVFRSVLLGLQRFDMTAKLQMTMALLNAGAIFFALRAGYGLKGLVVACLCIALITQLSQVVLAFVALPGLRSMRPVFDGALFKESFRYGVQVQVSKVNELINAQVDKFLIGHFLKIDMVGFYDLGAKIANVAKSIPMQIMPAIMPAASELDVLGGRERALALYFRATKYAALLSFPLTAFFCMHAPVVILAWIGKPGFENAALALRVLVLGNACVVLASAGRLVARGIGLPSFEMRAGILTTVLNVSLSLGLLVTIGFKGALIGTSVSLIAGAVYFLVAFHRHIQVSFIRRFLFEICAVPFAAAAAGAGLSLLPILFMGNWYPADRLQAMGYLAVCGIPFGAAYAFAVFLARYLDKSDVEILQRVVRMLFKPAAKTAGVKGY